MNDYDPIGENPLRNDWPTPQLWSELRHVSETSDYCMKCPIPGRHGSETVLDIPKYTRQREITAFRIDIGLEREKTRAEIAAERLERRFRIAENIKLRKEKEESRERNRANRNYNKQREEMQDDWHDDEAAKRKAVLDAERNDRIVDDADEAFRASVFRHKPFMAQINPYVLSMALKSYYGEEIKTEDIMQKAVNVYYNLGFISIDDLTDGEVLPGGNYMFVVKR